VIPIPISDENPTYRRPVVTWAIIFVNALVWLFQLGHGVDLSTLDFGAIPLWVVHGMREGRLAIPFESDTVGQLVDHAARSHMVWLHQEVPWPFTVLTSMFMHGSWLHIIGNMWFLWIFGDNVEDAMGRGRFVIFYLLCGALAALTQILSMPDSTVPMVGASGAIAGVLGAYAVLYPRARVRCLWVLIVFITFVRVPAWLLLGMWFLSQFLIPVPGVAWMAHVGGFIAGLLLVKLFVIARPAHPVHPHYDEWRRSY
jgi:membrane associated rhomboid family serine protease